MRLMRGMELGEEPKGFAFRQWFANSAATLFGLILVAIAGLMLLLLIVVRAASRPNIHRQGTSPEAWDGQGGCDSACFSHRTTPSRWCGVFALDDLAIAQWS
jgi:hypothetical protein